MPSSQPAYLVEWGGGDSEAIWIVPFVVHPYWQLGRLWEASKYNHVENAGIFISPALSIVYSVDFDVSSLVGSWTMQKPPYEHSLGFSFGINLSWRLIKLWPSYLLSMGEEMRSSLIIAITLAVPPRCFGAVSGHPMTSFLRAYRMAVSFP